MIKNVIETLGGIDVYGITSICFFFAFFTGMLWWAFRLKKNYLTSMQQLPLNDGSLDPKDNPSHPDSCHE